MSSSMTNANNDEAVSNFLAFTGCNNADIALSYLEMAGGDLETAVGLYVEHDGGNNNMISSAPSSFNSTTAVASSTRGQSPSISSSTRKMIMDDEEDAEDDNGGSFIPEMVEYAKDDDDAAWFTSAESTSTAAATSNAYSSYDSSCIRAPDQTQRMRLMEDDLPSLLATNRLLYARQMQPSGVFLGEDPQEAALAAYMMSTGGVSATDPLSSSAAAIGGNIWGSGPLDATANLQPHNTTTSTAFPLSDARSMVNAAAAAAAVAEASAFSDSYNTKISTISSLQNMFAPPPYAHRGGGFQGARNTAKDARRWLLVNIQSVEDFACHALNRDVWGDELVGNLVQEGFIFWQQNRTDPDGMTYVQRYNVQAFPHVGIIDPRTGRLMWRKEGWTQQDHPLTCATFAEIAADFCSRHSFEKPPTAPKQLPAHFNHKHKRPIEEMTEEEQLQEALKASMVQVNNDDTIMTEDEDEEVATNIPNTYNEEKKKSDDGVTFDTSVFRRMPLEEEPTSSDAVRIQFRMPDGQRVVRRFHKSDSIQMVYAFVYQYLDNSDNSDSVLQLRAGFPPKDLFSHTSSGGTVESCGLAGGQILASWK